MPAISKMNKKELAQEIEELGGTANLDRRRLELQVQLISLREEQGIPNHSRAAQTDYQKWTVAMNKAGPKKADLVRFMEQELQMTPRSNDTIVQLQKAALLKIYDLAAPHETDPVGFGQHSSLSYAETVAAHPEYVRWVRTTAAEGQCNPLMTRFYNWLEGQTSVGSNLEKTKAKPTTTPKAKTEPRGYPKSSATSAKAPSESQGSMDSQTMQQLVGVLQSLQKDVQELKSERRETRARKETHTDEEMIPDRSDGSFVAVSEFNGQK